MIPAEITNSAFILSNFSLKLWVDPYDEDGNAYGGGNNDYDTTLALAKRAQNLGMNILIDLSEAVDGLKIGCEICEDVWVPDAPDIAHALH